MKIIYNINGVNTHHSDDFQALMEGALHIHALIQDPMWESGCATYRPRTYWLRIEKGILNDAYIALSTVHIDFDKEGSIQEILGLVQECYKASYEDIAEYLRDILRDNSVEIARHLRLS